MFFTKWDEQDLECACLVEHPLCKDRKSCEELELNLYTYDDIVQCMKHEKYKKQGGVIKQI
jgi:hypothetical protein